jgi:acetyl-CoA C-acetyltransferase
MNEAVIVSAVRTPLGSFNGSLAGIGATDLGAIVIEEAVKRAGIEKAK